MLHTPAPALPRALAHRARSLGRKATVCGALRSAVQASASAAEPSSPRRARREEATEEAERAWWQQPKPPNMIVVKHVSELRAILEEMAKLAAEEFRDVIFLQVLQDEAAALAQCMDVAAFPTVQLFAGAQGRVAAFTAALTVEGMERMRSFLRYYRQPEQLSPLPAFRPDHRDWPTESAT